MMTHCQRVPFTPTKRTRQRNESESAGMSRSGLRRLDRSRQRGARRVLVPPTASDDECGHNTGKGTKESSRILPQFLEHATRGRAKILAARGEAKHVHRPSPLSPSHKGPQEEGELMWLVTALKRARPGRKEKGAPMLLTGFFRALSFFLSSFCVLSFLPFLFLSFLSLIPFPLFLFSPFCHGSELSRSFLSLPPFLFLSLSFNASL